MSNDLLYNLNTILYDDIITETYIDILALKQNTFDSF